MTKEVKGAALPLSNIQQIVSTAECFFREDFTHADENVKFEDMISRLGEPIDEDEISMLADCICKIFQRRMKILDDIEKMANNFSVEIGDDGTPILMSAGSTEREEEDEIF